MSFETHTDQSQPPEHWQRSANPLDIGATALEVTLNSQEGSFFINPVTVRDRGGDNVQDDPGFIPISPGQDLAFSHDELAGLSPPPSDVQRAFLLQRDFPKVQKLPEYRLIGKPNDLFDPGGYIRDLEKSRDNATFPTEATMTGKEFQTVYDVLEVLRDACSDLNIDPSDVMLSPHHFHFFDTEMDYRAGLEAIDVEYTQEWGAFINKVGVLWRRQPDADVNAYGLLHEAAHSLALRRVRAGPVRRSTDNSPAGRLFTGYRTLRAYGRRAVSDEVTTELLTHKAWPSLNRNAHFNGYGPVAALYHGAIQQAANKYRKPPGDIADKLIVGMLTGDIEGMRMIATTLGHERTQGLLQLDGDETYEEAAQIARTLDLPAASEAIEPRLAGEDLHIFTWY